MQMCFLNRPRPLSKRVIFGSTSDQNGYHPDALLGIFLFSALGTLTDFAWLFAKNCVHYSCVNFQNWCLPPEVTAPPPPGFGACPLPPS